MIDGIQSLPANPPGQGNPPEVPKLIHHAIALDMFGKPVITGLDSNGDIWVTRTRDKKGWERIPGPVIPFAGGV
jgi:hypothetical protein